MNEDEYATMLEVTRREIVADGASVGIVYDLQSGDVQLSCISSDQKIIDAQSNDIRRRWEFLRSAHKLPTFELRIDRLAAPNRQPVSEVVQI